jgi:hypothetical protein
MELLLQNGDRELTIWNQKNETGTDNRKKLIGSTVDGRRKSNIIDRALLYFQSKSVYSRNMFDVLTKACLIMNYVTTRKLKKII